MRRLLPALLVPLAACGASPQGQGPRDFAACTADKASAAQKVEACTRATKSVTGDERIAWVYLARSDAHHELGQLEAALADVDKALAADPKRGGALRSRAGVLMSLKRPTEAIESLEQALVLAPGDGASHLLLANIRENQGDFAR